MKMLVDPKTSKQQKEECIDYLLKLINVYDEPIFHDLVSRHLFDPEIIGGHTSLTLMGFFLGYC